ncbi:uncharacterized protein LOC143029674 [Oratosquilla oratoria]|uniref:uncharacterized protein LOC143029674 n=1 Tax=Oratosquilla oratoria TaxID=337810 RepID=UPI003F76E8DA
MLQFFIEEFSTAYCKCSEANFHDYTSLGLFVVSTRIMNVIIFVESSQENSRKRKRLKFILRNPVGFSLLTSLKAKILLYKSASKATRVPVSGSSSSKKHLRSPEDVSTMMKVTGALVVACLLALVSMEAQAQGATCRRWCDDGERFYCCREEHKPPGPEEVKLNFSCPPPKKECVSSGPPVICSDDSYCQGNDKCCLDTCLGSHVCMASLPSPPVRG